MTYVEQLHAIADRIGEADARITAALADRQAAVDELHQLLEVDQPASVPAVGGAPLGSLSGPQSGMAMGLGE